MHDSKTDLEWLSPLVVACHWWWGRAVVGPAQWRPGGSHGSVLHFLSSGCPRWEMCSQSVCSLVAVSAGGSQNSWARMWGMSSSPHSSCQSPPRHVEPGGYHSCSVSFSYSISSGCHMSTLPPCAGKKNWTDSIQQCSTFSAKCRALFSWSCCKHKNKVYNSNAKVWGAWQIMWERVA